jgi:hypothetical protein
VDSPSTQPEELEAPADFSSMKICLRAIKTLRGEVQRFTVPARSKEACGAILQGNFDVSFS